MDREIGVGGDGLYLPIILPSDENYFKPTFKRRVRIILMLPLHNRERLPSLVL